MLSIFNNKPKKMLMKEKSVFGISVRECIDEQARENPIAQTDPKTMEANRSSSTKHERERRSVSQTQRSTHFVVIDLWLCGIE